MKIFFAAGTSGHVDYETGKVSNDYRLWVESEIAKLESWGHEVFSSLRDEGYIINNSDPAAGHRKDCKEIDKADAVVAYIEEKVSVGTQVELGYALAKGKKILIVHQASVSLPWYNRAMILAGDAVDVTGEISADLLG